MEANHLDLDAWLMKKVKWMVEETSAYMDTRELLSLCQTVAVIRLNQTLQALGVGQELAGVRQAVAEQTAALANLLQQQAPSAKK